MVRSKLKKKTTALKIQKVFWQTHNTLPWWEALRTKVLLVTIFANWKTLVVMFPKSIEVSPTSESSSLRTENLWVLIAFSIQKTPNPTIGYLYLIKVASLKRSLSLLWKVLNIKRTCPLSVMAQLFHSHSSSLTTLKEVESFVSMSRWHSPGVKSTTDARCPNRTVQLLKKSKKTPPLCFQPLQLLLSLFFRSLHSDTENPHRHTRRRQKISFTLIQI